MSAGVTARRETGQEGVNQLLSTRRNIVATDALHVMPRRENEGGGGTNNSGPVCAFLKVDRTGCQFSAEKLR